jgi:hypothetical protein
VYRITRLREALERKQSGCVPLNQDLTDQQRKMIEFDCKSAEQQLNEAKRIYQASGPVGIGGGG